MSEGCDNSFRAACGRTLGLDVGKGAGWPVPETHRARFAPFEGQPFEIGFRPEHVQHGAAASPGSATFNAIPDVIESTGADTMVFFDMNGAHSVARLSPEVRVTQGEALSLSVSFSRLYGVDVETGRMVLPVAA